MTNDCLMTWMIWRYHEVPTLLRKPPDGSRYIQQMADPFDAEPGPPTEDGTVPGNATTWCHQSVRILQWRPRRHQWYHHEAKLVGFGTS